MSFSLKEYWLNALQDLRPTTQRAHVEVLTLIARYQGITRAHIAYELGRTPGGLHVTLERLLRRGLVVRHQGYVGDAKRPSYFYYLKPVLLNGETTCYGRFGDAFQVKRRPPPSFL